MTVRLYSELGIVGFAFQTVQRFDRRRLRRFRPDEAVQFSSPLAAPRPNFLGRSFGARAAIGTSSAVTVTMLPSSWLMRLAIAYDACHAGRRAYRGACLYSLETDDAGHDEPAFGATPSAAGRRGALDAPGSSR